MAVSTIPLASAVSGTLPDGSAPSGSVIQVVQAYKSDTFSTSVLPSGWSDITGLSVSITPISASSKIYVAVSCAISSSSASFAYIMLVRNSTPLFIGDASAGRPSLSGMAFNGGYNEGALVSIPICYLDSPATTSSTTYKLQLASGVSGATVYVNRSARDQAETNYDPRQASSIILMEIAG
jgi:hypothetical protein